MDDLDSLTRFLWQVVETGEEMVPSILRYIAEEILRMVFDSVGSEYPQVMKAQD